MLRSAGVLFVRGTLFEELLRHGLWVDFDTFFTVFFQKASPFPIH